MLKPVGKSLFCQLPRPHTFLLFFPPKASYVWDGPFVPGCGCVVAQERGDSVPFPFSPVTLRKALQLPSTGVSLSAKKWLELRAKKRVTVCSAHCSFLTLDSSGCCDVSSNSCAMCSLAKNPSVERDLEIIYSNHFFCRLRNIGGGKLESLA